MEAAVNHSGDSDSTGSLCLGINAIPKACLDNLELKEIIIQMAAPNSVPLYKR